jgi:hypothetical protein
MIPRWLNTCNYSPIKTENMQPSKRTTDLSPQNDDDDIRNTDKEFEEELDEASGDLDDDVTAEPVLDETDLEENDLTEEDLDDIEWEEPNNERS